MHVHHVSAGASVDSYFLADYATSAVQPPGKFKVLSMQAQASPAGRLQAYFEIVLTPSVNSLKTTPLDVIYALGDLARGEIQASHGILLRTTPSGKHLPHAHLASAGTRKIIVMTSWPTMLPAPANNKSTN